MKILKAIYDKLARGPVLVGAFVLASLKAAYPEADDLVQAAWLAGVTLFQHMLSTSEVGAKERVETARYVGAVEQANAHSSLVLAEQEKNKPVPKMPITRARKK